MMLKINIKIMSAISLILLISACSIAGSWAFGKLDNYLNDYFFTFANFSETQKKEIETVTENFKYWLVKEQLTEIKLLLSKVNSLDSSTTEAEINSIYEESYIIVKSVTSYFDSELVKFSLSLDEKQINEIENHFLELQEKRKKEDEDREKETYQERLQKNYISGFKRIGIKLNNEQTTALTASVKGIVDNGDEWDQLQANWTKEMISILRTNQEEPFKEELKRHLVTLFDLGPPSFREKVERNQIISIKAVTKVVNSMNDDQFKKMRKRVRVYIRSVDKILKNQNQEEAA